MNGVNFVIIQGNAGSEPKLRYSASGVAVGSFSVATNRGVKDAQGEWQKETEWHRIVALGRLGEIAGQLVKKGSLLLIHGRLQTQEWKDAEGRSRRTTEIVADRLDVLDRRRESDGPVEVAANGSREHEADIPF